MFIIIIWDIFLVCVLVSFFKNLYLNHLGVFFKNVGYQLVILGSEILHF